MSKTNQVPLWALAYNEWIIHAYNAARSRPGTIDAFYAGWNAALSQQGEREGKREGAV